MLSRLRTAAVANANAKAQAKPKPKAKAKALQSQRRSSVGRADVATSLVVSLRLRGSHHGCIHVSVRRLVLRFCQGRLPLQRQVLLRRRVARSDVRRRLGCWVCKQNARRELWVPGLVSKCLLQGGGPSPRTVLRVISFNQLP